MKNRDKDDLEKRYAKILEQRQKNIEKNIIEGRSIGKIKNKQLVDDITSETDKMYQMELDRRRDNLTKNLLEGRTNDLESVPAVMELKGAKIQNLSNEVKKADFDDPAISKAVKIKSKLPKLKKALGIIGPVGAAIGSLGVAEKAMAGDLKGAIGEAYESYMPDIAKPTELGNADFNPSMLNDPNIKELQKRMFAGHIVDDGARQGKMGEKVDQPSGTTINEGSNPEEKVRLLKLRQLLEQNR